MKPSKSFGDVCNTLLSTRDPGADPGYIEDYFTEIISYKVGQSIKKPFEVEMELN